MGGLRHVGYRGRAHPGDQGGAVTLQIIDELRRRGHWVLVCTMARAYFTTPGGVIGSRRRKRDVEARHAVWASLYGTGRYSLPDLAAMFGRDHTTILAGVRRHRERLGRSAA